MDDLLPPGTYTFVVERTRKVRNKPLRRVYMRMVDGPQAGITMTQTFRDDDVLAPGLSEGQVRQAMIRKVEKSNG